MNKKTHIMKNKMKSVATSIQKHIKIKLDHKTTITLKDMTRFDYWKELYPNAVIIS